MQAETVPLWPASCGIASSLVRFAGDDRTARPAVLVIPGGGYHSVCEDTEGTPVAARFEALGYRTFVLRYRVAGDRAKGAPPHPPLAPLADAVRAMRLVRGNAADWGVSPREVAVCGFSAGGHLAAALGTIADAVDARAGDRFDDIPPVPDAMLLGYPLLLSGSYGHRPSRENFFAHAPSPAEDLLFSLDRHVSEATPPAFLWTTAEDTLVPMENSLAFCDAMRGRGRPFDLHVFPHGPHGMQLGYGRGDIAQWPDLASAFLRETCGFRLPGAPCPGTVALTFDDCPRSHLSLVAPLLREYGFGATFFVTRFDDAWRAAHGDSLLPLEDVRRLSDMGFEIGNHTWSHACGLDSPADAVAEIDRLDEWLVSGGVPRPRVFAYPGGGFRPVVVPLLKERGYVAARAAEPGTAAWRPGADDPFRLPSLPVAEGSDAAFYRYFHGPNPGDVPPDAVPVLVFHGVPDRVHPWCNTEPATFRKLLAFLRGRGYRCVSLSEALAGAASS